MKVICINKYHWYDFEGLMCGYLGENPQAIKGIEYNQECETTRILVCRMGDMFYIIEGKAWEAEFFIPLVESKQDHALTNQELTINL